MVRRPRLTTCCPNGWTGGQYSVFRFALGACLLAHLLCLIEPASEISGRAGALAGACASALSSWLREPALCWSSRSGIIALLIAGAGSSALLALGVRDRLACLAVLCTGVALFATSPLLPDPSVPFFGLLLLAHAFVPRRPYGSWDARGRSDPAGGWRMPTRVYAAAWVALAAHYAYSGATKLDSPAWIDGTALTQALQASFAGQTSLGALVLRLPSELLALATWSALALQLGFLPLVIPRKIRPWPWLALLCAQLGGLALGHLGGAGAGLVMLHLLAFDPGWVKGAAGRRPATIFYDGDCGLCHCFVRFALAEDSEGRQFRFAPRQSRAFAALREASERPAALDAIDSIVLSLPDGRWLVRGAAVLAIGQRLGGIWRLAAIAARIVPLRALDAAYAGIARVRHRIFAKPDGVCPILPAQLRARFELD